jgi:hypothetical protein
MVDGFWRWLSILDLDLNRGERSDSSSSQRVRTVREPLRDGPAANILPNEKFYPKSASHERKSYRIKQIEFLDITTGKSRVPDWLESGEAPTPILGCDLDYPATEMASA